ncbi:MAG TPA: protein kinase [Gemmataceae bacterium]|nr:protein kinase [Gemmataceae bacterium]
MPSEADRNPSSGQEAEPCREDMATADHRAADSVADRAAPAAPQSTALLSVLRPPQAAGELGRLAGFSIMKLLGQGGMGAVFEAHDPLVRRRVALKVMKPELTARPESYQRFLREARTAAAVEHDRIIPVYQVGEDNGVLFIAMPLLQGESLDRRLAREKRLPIPAILKLGRETAEGLAAAHARGLMHRDIKPGNLWLEGTDESGAEFRRVKILDFGLARAVHDDTHLTAAGGILGTPAYMAPEQADAQETDHRADLFSLGAVLYRCCTGEAPFKGPSTLAILSALANKKPAPVREKNPDVPPALADLIMRLLAKAPGERPQSAQEVAEILRRIEQEYALPSPKKVSKRPRSRWKAAFTAAVLGLGLMAAAGVIVVKVRGPGGKESEVTAPEGSKIAVDAKGNVTVTLPPDKLASPAVKPGPNAPAKQADPAELECRLKAGNSYVTALVITPDGNSVIAAYQDRCLRVWDLKERKIVRTHTSDTWVSALALHPDGKTVAFTCWDGGLLTWDAGTGKVLRRFTGPSMQSCSVSFAHRGETLVASDNATKSVICWETATGKHKVLAHYPKGSSHGSVQVAPDGEHVALVTQGEPVSCVTDGDPVQLLELSSGKVVWTSRLPGCCASPVFTSDGKKSLVASTGHVKVWDLKTRNPESAFGEQRGPFYGLAISPENRFLAAACGTTGEVRLFDLAGPPYPIRVWAGLTPNYVTRVAFTPDGRRLLSTHADGTICVFKVPQNLPRRRGFPPLDPAWLARTTQMPADEQVKEVTAELIRRNPGFNDPLHVLKDGDGRVCNASVQTVQLEDLSPFRGFPALRSLGVVGKNWDKLGRVWDLSCLKGMNLLELNLSFNRVWDLSPLREMPLTDLELVCNLIWDLSPLQKMRLRTLSVASTNVDDISPLRGMPLETVSLDITHIKNLSALSKSPLKRVAVSAPDLEPLRDLPLEWILLQGDYKPEQIKMILRIPTLKDLLLYGKYTPEQLKEFRGNPILNIINNKPAAEFWKSVEKK